MQLLCCLSYSICILNILVLKSSWFAIRLIDLNEFELLTELAHMDIILKVKEAELGDWRAARHLGGLQSRCKSLDISSSYHDRSTVNRNCVVVLILQILWWLRPPIDWTSRLLWMLRLCSCSWRLWYISFYHIVVIGISLKLLCLLLLIILIYHEGQ